MGDTTKDVPYEYLTFFLEDDNELEQIRKRLQYVQTILLLLQLQDLFFQQLHLNDVSRLNTASPINALPN